MDGDRVAEGKRDLVVACNEAIKFLNRKKPSQSGGAPELIELAKLYIETIKAIKPLPQDETIIDYLQAMENSHEKPKPGWIDRAIAWVARNLHTPFSPEVHDGYVIIAGLQMQMARLLPDDSLRQFIWSIQLKFRYVFGEDRAKKYEEALSPQNLEKLDNQTLVSYLQMLISDLYSAYIINYEREVAVRSVKRLIGSSSIGLTVVAIASSLVLYFTAPGHLFYLPIITIFGIIGASISITRRLQIVAQSPIGSISDPILEINSLRLGKAGIFVALCSGALFPLLLAVLFSSGILGAVLGVSLSPVFKSSADAILFPDLVDSASFAKLAAWSFIAGFAERFMPDILDRMVQRGLSRVEQSPVGK